ncbi:hypothetical protein [Paenibacillus sp. L3-i20]|uniref:pyroglutamyl-peptidase I family protein n=1 Tax=Paenibacillus sp. L3-i20 TaxID=2905833 RepID=UPI001EE03B92|nr:hypothetical protein [Paenibacillus sp. L3-i20]GKU80076.1 hypothetical protein L3i20_v244730 [Paenibacillus sp. L3-i20]
MKKVLVTGFDPFGGELINPAWESVYALSHLKSAHYQVQVCKLPTVFQKSLDRLYSAIEEIEPHLILCVGAVEMIVKGLITTIETTLISDTDIVITGGVIS